MIVEIEIETSFFDPNKTHWSYATDSWAYLLKVEVPVGFDWEDEDEILNALYDETPGFNCV